MAAPNAKKQRISTAVGGAVAEVAGVSSSRAGELQGAMQAYGGCDASDPTPYNPNTNAMLTDMYQMTMCYAYWKAKRHETPACFDMFFRKPPFKGEFCVFGGLSQVLAFLHSYKITEAQLDYLKTLMPDVDDGFFEWLANVDCSQVRVHAFKEGSIVFPREPLLRVEGPIGICQLLETTLLCIVNYASLVATYAARMRVAVGPCKTLLEMGLRRAQGPDGGLSASRYAHIGGFDATSNVLAGQLFGIKVSGTHAHAFVQSFSGLSDLASRRMCSADGTAEVDFVALVLKYRAELQRPNTNMGELSAYIAYCQALPASFLALVDTYDTLESGLPNFIACALALIEIGYFPLGLRLDSGDLGALSIQARAMLKETEARYSGSLRGVEGLGAVAIVASNDIDEDRLCELQAAGHEIDTFGIGTHLVTCQAQPALGCVYKLVEMRGAPRIKLSQDRIKISVPCKKRLFRLYDAGGVPMGDVMMSEDEFESSGPPNAGQAFVGRDPIEPATRATLTPASVSELLICVWDGRLTHQMESLAEVRGHCQREIASLSKHTRRHAPEPYLVSLSDALFETMHSLWMCEAPK